MASGDQAYACDQIRCARELIKWLTKALPLRCAGPRRIRTCSHHTSPEGPSGSPGSWCRCWRHHWTGSRRGGGAETGDSWASSWWSGGYHWESHWHMDLWSHSCLSGPRMIIAILKCEDVTELRPKWHKNSHKNFPLISSLHLYLHPAQSRLHLLGYLILGYK